jgi:hypothetical protein
MKCVCGYETGYDYEKEEESGYEKFVRLNVIFLTPEQRGLYDGYDQKTNALYMCPECGTVRAERD